jgi:hypothetical protein
MKVVFPAPWAQYPEYLALLDLEVDAFERLE